MKIPLKLTDFKMFIKEEAKKKHTDSSWHKRI